jgi:hypothetical protein
MINPAKILKNVLTLAQRCKRSLLHQKRRCLNPLPYLSWMERQLISMTYFASERLVLFAFFATRAEMVAGVSFTQ